jgi:hypothetical protein
MGRVNKGIIFLVLLIVILGIYLFYDNRRREGFDDIAAEMPSASFAGVAKTAPKMWVDGSRQPTARERVASMIEDMKAFFAFEAGGLEDISDPAVQVPLVTAKGDLKTLESEALFLKKNPGVAPNVTMTQMQEMEANLDGLRRRARVLSGDVDQVEGFFTTSDLPDIPSTDYSTIMDTILSNYYSANTSLNTYEKRTNAFNTIITGLITTAKTQVGNVSDNTNKASVAANEMTKIFDKVDDLSGAYTKITPAPKFTFKRMKYEYLTKIVPSNTTFGSNLTSPAFYLSRAFEAKLDTFKSEILTELNAAPTNNTPSGSDSDSSGCTTATLTQIKGLDDKIYAEITRLSANGTTDTVIAARVKNLQTIRKSVKEVIRQVESDQLAESEIPIYTCDIDNFLKVLGTEGQSKGIPALFQKLGLSSFFPSGTDPETIKQVNNLITKYGEKLMNGLSTGVSLTTAFRYVSPNEVAASQNPITVNINGAPTGTDSTGIDYSSASTSTSTISSTGFPSMNDLINIASGSSVSSGSSAGAGAAGSFDWKKRTGEICAAVKKRGLDPLDFGCLKTDEVSNSFDWRGQAKMVCSRLSTSYETGLPELVGCPDFNWPGWASRQIWE